MESVIYDEKDPKSIESFAKKLIGHTFMDVIKCQLTESNLSYEQIQSYSNVKRKGGLGNLLEEVYFGYATNSNSVADFKEAGVELKATPYEISTKGKYRAGERLVLSMIDYNAPIEPELSESHMWQKCKLLLLIFYLRTKTIENKLMYPIHFVSLFTPTPTDIQIIKSDYKIIAEKISSGKAENLSEADTLYLGACTKGATAEKSIVAQYYPPYSMAKKRAFCYKNSYMTFVLNEYIMTGKETYESIIHDPYELQDTSFEQYIISKLNLYKGKSDKYLCELFDREYNNNKAQWTDLVYRMLGIKSNRAAEFRKANITVKVIRLEENGKMHENISFPPFKYKELICENWENSTLHDYFDENRFLFVIFKKSCDGYYYLTGCRFWNMPYDDLNTIVRTGWQKIVDSIKNGISFTVKETSSGIVVENNLPKKSDNPIIHIRPHAQKRYYQFTDGKIIGNGTKADANQLPDGTWMPHYSFWINNDYILKQLGIQ